MVKEFFLFFHLMLIFQIYEVWESLAFVLKKIKLKKIVLTGEKELF
jgi:hypothetical protein